MTELFTPLLHLEAVGADRFRADPAPERSGRMFGGQFMAQALTAAQQTLDDDRVVHSLHAYFLRAGDVDKHTEFVVERVRDGRSFSSRMAVAVQDGKEMFRMTLSFHVPEDGLEYSASAMPDAPAAEDVAITYNDFAEASLAQTDPWDGAARPMDIRYVNAPTAPLGEPVVADQLMWMRITGALPATDAVHAAGLVYLSDSTLVDHVRLPHGRRWHEPGFDGASLDHAMWLHRPARADEWLLLVQRVETTGGARGLASGRFYSRDGALVATCVQEGLMREAE